MDSTKEKLITDNLHFAPHIAKRYINCGIDMEELISICYLGMVKAAESYNGSTAFTTYSGTVMKNEILQELRKRRKRPTEVSLDDAISSKDGEGELTLADILPVDDEGFKRTEDRIFHVTAVKSLNPRERQILDYTWQGKRQKEIGELLGMSQSYVSKIMRRAALKYYRGGYEMVDRSEVSMAVCAASVIMALLLHDCCGMVIAPTVLYGVATICVVIAYCNIGSGRKHRRKRKQR